MSLDPLDRLAVDTIRMLAVDAVQEARSGHPGTEAAMVPVAYTLWQRFLRFDPEDPIWPDRDRFVLSTGHASALLYALLHLSGVRAVNPKYETLGEPAVSLDDLRSFRQPESRCPGNPEYRWTSGVEATTGPLGQGAASSVGMAIGSRWMAAYFNRPFFEMFSYAVFALLGDGDLMEGVTAEAASLAGHLGLSNLCWLWDNNRVTIEGPTSLAFSEDVATRFLGYGWNVLRVGDANDLDMLTRAFQTFRRTVDRPTLVIVDSHIGWGAPGREDAGAAHGEPLSEEEVRLKKRACGWPEDSGFLVPPEARARFREGIARRGGRLREDWMARFERYKAAYPKEADELYRMQHRRLPDDWDRDLPVFPADAKGLAGRDASAQVLNAVARNVPWLVGGSADLSPSTRTRLTFEGAGDFSARNAGGRNLRFGVREHAMAAILNGLSLAKVRPFGSGFLVFSDYARPAIRLAALMEIPVIHVLTHDSVGVGEDGPSHQPVEQLASLRAIPGLVTLRPADANEVVEAWRVILKLRHEPVALVLSRQPVPTFDRQRLAPASGLSLGAYVLADSPEGPLDVLLIGTGSEVSLCLEAHETLRAEGIRSRVVSMPSFELFERQPEAYRRKVLPPEVTGRVSVEQASTFGWERYVGATGRSIGMKSFGASAPLKELQKKLGVTVEAVLAAARQQASGKPSD